MAGVKGRSGGARNGAGRKPRQPILIEESPGREERIPNGDGIDGQENPVEVILAGDGKDPMQFLEDVMANPTMDAKFRIEAAKILMPFKHVRKGDVGKKTERQASAQKAAGGKFAASAPPLRVVGNR
ncbi:hypothetical protein [Azonexus sp. IMCC34839]|uniref:hypothetical protein n=1 Tax=Azonexus sp. IMCC34839 TaxID=3133695 RepID=UPI00399A1EDB